MKKIFLLFAFVLLAFSVNAQVNSETITKKVVKDGPKFYIETKTVKLEYTPVDFNILFLVENDSLEDAQDNILVEQFKAERLRLKTERAERNKLLKDAIKKGYEPQTTSQQEIDRVNKIKSKLK